MENYLIHHGILGQKWGIRRYQNKDGSLTDEGRKRLGLDVYDKNYNTDSVIKKGTKVSRVVSTSRYDEWKDPRFGGSEEKAKKYLKDVLDKDQELDSKYVSIDNYKNSGRANGKEFYTSWFTDEGWDPDYGHITMYELKKDSRVASGKKVVDELLKEVGSQKITEMLKNNKNIKTLTMDYTTNKELFERINKKFKDMGYDAIEDINDLDTDMPAIFLDSKKSLGKRKSVQSGRDAIEEMYKKYK